MIIRCERCSTLYELDETLLAPEGSPVQCTRCQAIFSARPPRPATPNPGAEGPGPALPEQVAPPAPELQAAPLVQPETVAAPAPAGPSPFAKPLQRPARPGPAVYRPPAAQPPKAANTPAGRAREARRGAAEARGRRASPWWRRLLIPAAVVVLVALVAGGTVLWRRRPDPVAAGLAREATAALALDDAGSLTRAVKGFDDLLARIPGRADALAGRALARVLLSAAQLEEAEPLEVQFNARVAERERLLAEPPSGVEDALRQVAVETTRLEGELAPRRKRAEELAVQASGELRTLAAMPGSEQAAARGLALLAVLAHDRDEATRQAALARSRGPEPWADLAEAWLDLGTPDRSEYVAKGLSRLAAEHPELLRARFLLARAQAAGGHREEALATLAGLLAANPRHERAQWLKGLLSAPPPAAIPAPAAAATPARVAAPAVQAPPPRVWIPAPAPLPPPPPAGGGSASGPNGAAPVAPTPSPAATPPPAAPEVTPPPPAEPQPLPPPAVKPAPKPTRPIEDESDDYKPG